MKRIRRNVQLTQAQYDALKKEASERGFSFSGFVVQSALHAALESRVVFATPVKKKVGSKDEK